jgi:exodeoxyribonuclease-5
MTAVEQEIKGIRRHFHYEPTGDQQVAIRHIAAFGISRKPNPMYLLKGYAGTGKTSLVSAFVNFLNETGRKFVLMAPTGRAAKVLAQYTGSSAYTIHRRIYHTVTQKDGRQKLTLSQNKMQNTVFLVDEASMISDYSLDKGMVESAGSLLDDLMQFVFAQSGNKLLLVGDTAQLPPVGLDISPALDPDYLRNAFNLTAFSFEMREVMRQALDSGILKSATFLRSKIEEDAAEPPFFLQQNFEHDVRIIEDGYMLEDLMQTAFSGNEDTGSIVITRSNKSANLYNEQIRSRIQLRESVLEAGDKIMVVKNNYFWLSPESKAGFIANGDLAYIVRINHLEEMYGFRFAEAEIQLSDYPEEKELTVKLLLETLSSPGSDISAEEQRRLFDEVSLDYMSIPQRRKRLEAVKKDPYFNALHVKYAYAITCHKTQGGQWPVVFVDQGYVSEEQLNTEYLRWLYTAFTRATEKVFLTNFNPEFFD